MKASEELFQFFQTHEWTKGTNVRRNGNPISIAWADDSCSFCLNGAVMFLGKIIPDFPRKFHSEWFREFPTLLVSNWNDNPYRTKADVFEILTRLAKKPIWG